MTFDLESWSNREEWEAEEQVLTEPLNIWGLPAVGTRPAGGLPPLHASKYGGSAKLPGECPLLSVSRQGQKAQPPGDSRELLNPAEEAACHENTSSGEHDVLARYT